MKLVCTLLLRRSTAAGRDQNIVDQNYPFRRYEPHHRMHVFDVLKYFSGSNYRNSAWPAQHLFILFVAILL